MTEPKVRFEDMAFLDALMNLHLRVRVLETIIIALQTGEPVRVSLPIVTDAVGVYGEPKESA